MKKLEGRAILCLTLVAVLVLGMLVFLYKLGVNGSKWATFYGNNHVFTNGQLNIGKVYDRNGIILLKNNKEGMKYNEDAEIRKATLHLVGDRGYNIVTGADVAFRKELIGYNHITGNDGFLKRGGTLRLTIDSELNRIALKSMGNREGLIGVYNYKTGEILTMLSTPTIDPDNSSKMEDIPSGTFINKLISAKFTPGSVFKILTLQAALENISDLDTWSFNCTGKYEVNGEYITCPKVHGLNDIYGALSNSCNCAFANLSEKIGADILTKYTENAGLTKEYDIDGIKTEKGKFTFPNNSLNLGWASIGQYEDQINPMSMLIYMGAIAGGGETAIPHLLKSQVSGKKVKIMKKSTAKELSKMLRNNVINNYGDGNFPSLELHAKSGTAEMEKGNKPNGWLVGYSGDYAFICLVEKGGYGAGVAGPIVNSVLQEIKRNYQ